MRDNANANIGFLVDSNIRKEIIGFEISRAISLIGTLTLLLKSITE
jgi:hypothetical protein